MTAKQMALGGISAALAVAILCLGGLIPLATYILPMICCILLQMILPAIGNKGGWIWYCVVGILDILLCPDKEAAATLAFLGWYPMVKPMLDGKAWGTAVKLLLFNLAIFSMYALLIGLLGFAALGAEFHSLGTWMTLLTLILGNICFYLLDLVLFRFSKISKK